MSLSVLRFKKPGSKKDKNVVSFHQRQMLKILRRDFERIKCNILKNPT